VHRARRIVADRSRAPVVEQLDARAVALEIHGVQVDVLDPQQGARRFAADLELRDALETEQVAIEADRTIEIRDTDTDMGQTQHRHMRSPEFPSVSQFTRMRLALRRSFQWELTFFAKY